MIKNHRYTKPENGRYTSPSGDDFWELDVEALGPTSAGEAIEGFKVNPPEIAENQARFFVETLGWQPGCNQVDFANFFEGIHFFEFQKMVHFRVQSSQRLL